MRLKDDGKGKKKNGSGGGGGVSDDLSVMHDRIRKLGKFYTVIYSTTIDASAFQETIPDFEHDDPVRYINDENIELGPTAELYACIPETLQQYISTIPSFAQEVSKSELLNTISNFNTLFPVY